MTKIILENIIEKVKYKYKKYKTKYFRIFYIRYAQHKKSKIQKTTVSV